VFIANVEESTARTPSAASNDNGFPDFFGMAIDDSVQRPGAAI
jgi:hypothetical protein